MMALVAVFPTLQPKIWFCLDWISASVKFRAREWAVLGSDHSTKTYYQ
jgi:hypothetical protein